MSEQLELTEIKNNFESKVNIKVETKQKCEGKKDISCSNGIIRGDEKMSSEISSVYTFHKIRRYC